MLKVTVMNYWNENKKTITVYITTNLSEANKNNISLL